MDYRILFAVVFLNVIVSPVLSASTTTSNYENSTDITTGSTATIPISNETSTLPPNENGTTVTLPPIENGTTVTLPAENSTITIGPAVTGTTETPRETTASSPVTTVRPAKTSGSNFDGGSFGGGIALGAVIIAIMFGVCYFCRRRQGYSNLNSMT